MTPTPDQLALLDAFIAAWPAAVEAREAADRTPLQHLALLGLTIFQSAGSLLAYHELMTGAHQAYLSTHPAPPCPCNACTVGGMPFALPQPQPPPIPQGATDAD